MRTLNLGILAHVDAGKTSLTERLLYAAGVINEVGSVDDGNTQTDSLALERQRGITIRSAVVSFVVGDLTVNLIDTPGHPDFIAEVERVLNVLDSAVLVISAVEGVQAQTRVLMRTVQRLNIPTLIFVNKIDRGGAQCERVLQSIAEKLTSAIIPMGSVRDLGTRNALYIQFGMNEPGFTSQLLDHLTDHDDTILAAYVRDPLAVSDTGLRAEFCHQINQALVHPVYFGSAITGAGVDSLIVGIQELLLGAEGDTEGPVSGTVFKVERGPAGEKIAYVRMFSGTVRVRDRLQYGPESEGKVTAIQVFDRGTVKQRPSVASRQIGKLWGLSDVQIGNSIGMSLTSFESHHFAPPILEAIVAPCRRSEKGVLHSALTQLAEQDPLINLRQDDLRGEIYVSLYGEVQKEVIQATLADDFNVAVDFRDTTTICIERPIGTGSAVERIGQACNPFLATLGLFIEPAPTDSGLELRLEVAVETIPLYVYKSVDDFQKAIEETVRETLSQGLYGWQVTDCRVTVIESGCSSPGSTARDFRLLTPLVVMSALKHAGTQVCEPIQRFHLVIPDDTFGASLSALARLGAVPQSSAMHGSSYTLEGQIAAARVHELQQQVPALTRGEGVLECTFDCYLPVRGAIPTRPRSDYNPLNRKEYLLHVLRRV